MLSFLMHVVGEYKYAEMSGNFLRNAFPSDRLIIVGDGVGNDRWMDIAKNLNAEFIHGERLFGSDKGGEVVHRWLDICIGNSQPSYIFKIDPDTHVWRNFKSLPVEECLFGTLNGRHNNEPNYPSLQGGCIGATYSAAKKLYHSKLLLCDELKKVETWAGKNKFCLKRGNDKKLTSFDWTLGWAASKLDIKMIDCLEIKSFWNKEPENIDDRYSITHPDGNLTSKIKTIKKETLK